MAPDHPVRVTDRRRSPRHAATRLPSLRASILAGPDVSVINVSRGGLLLESEVRLQPGLGICLNLTLDGRLHVVNGRIARVDATIIEGLVRYRAGVVLDEESNIFDGPAEDSPEPPEQPIAAAAAPADLPARSSPDTELPALRQQLEIAQAARAQQASLVDSMRATLESGEQLRREMIEAHAAERTRWASELETLETRVREAEEQVASMVVDMRAARDAARRGNQQHAEERALLDARVRERDQQLAEVRAAQAALLESLTHRLQTYERHDAAERAQQRHIEAQLTTTETWCADQQDLLYRIRQQMNAVFVLLQGGDPVDRSLPPIDQDALAGRGETRLLTARADQVPVQEVERQVQT